MTLNVLERRNSPYFAFCSPNLIALLTTYLKVVEDRPVMSAKYCIAVPVFHFWPKSTLQRGLSAMTELLVEYSMTVNWTINSP